MGDIYSFAIIMQEVLVRGEPFCMLTLTPEGKPHRKKLCHVRETKYSLKKTSYQTHPQSTVLQLTNEDFPSLSFNYNAELSVCKEIFKVPSKTSFPSTSFPFSHKKVFYYRVYYVLNCVHYFGIANFIHP